MLRVWNIINPPNKGIYHLVKSPEEAIELINVEAQIQLQNPNIHSNAFGLEMLENDKWVEWEHEELGVQIDEYERILEEENENRTEI